MPEIMNPYLFHAGGFGKFRACVLNGRITQRPLAAADAEIIRKIREKGVNVEVV